MYKQGSTHDWNVRVSIAWSIVVCGCVSCQGASGRQLERCSARVAVRIRINLAGRLSRIRLNLASTQPCLFNTTSGGAIIISKMESRDPETQRKPVPTLSGARRSKTRSRRLHFFDARLPSPACVPLGARGTNELGRTFPGGAGVRFFLFFFFLFFFLFFFI